MFHAPAHKQGSLKAGDFTYRAKSAQPPYVGKLWEDMTPAEQAQFERDAEDAHYEMLSRGVEFPRGEFAFN